MKRFLPIAVVVVLLGVAGYFLLINNTQTDTRELKTLQLGSFDKVRGCAVLPPFLYNRGIKRPLIDLSQLHYKGVAFYYGPHLKQVLHKKEWERFDALGTYSIDRAGNIYLTPNPFISIEPTTFNLQKAIYKMDAKRGNLKRWMVIDEVSPDAHNPYGLISVLYDCKDGTLWASAIDKTGYKGSRGRIYHINPDTKEILGKVQGFDALTLAWLQSRSGRFLLAGSALDSAVYAFGFKDGKLAKEPIKLFALPNPKLHVRKIRVVGKDTLRLEAIKFTYSLIAETNKKRRAFYKAVYDAKKKTWSVAAIKE